MSRVAPVLKYPGSKWNIAEWIISYFPPHTSYLEPFFGSGAVFFSKKPSYCETINDISGDVVNLFKVIRDHPNQLSKLIEYTPWARAEYDMSYEKTEDDIENARRFLIRCWMAFASSTSARVGWKNDVRGRAGAAGYKIWQKVPDRIYNITSRLKQAQIENKTALEIIKRHRYSEILIYADPPYPLATRSGKIYAYEMTDIDHEQLLDALMEHPGPVVLSGYSCDLYNNKLKEWEVKTKMAAAEKGNSREEVIWINPVASGANRSLFNINGEGK